ncbi:ATPase [Dehalococcoides mccartyi]|uniref:histidine kinase N-terminal 7TM domain-containing protein n=1 Tax=Dehalococcoides mccartyi TaxID=61435 RepID=UPI0002B77072|nr:histidine kinase N-terminal 7TM domain-containing protein [Dehalococcoides mccartyi]AGG08537.1 PAS/PAC sensor signal transduction histidine kinase/response regulator [Dehalococcoides mccartyi BTF08]KSV18289.1 ATPase [Dehalococcoides mccartyi]
MSESYLFFYYLAMTISLLACLTVVVLSWKNREAPVARSMLALGVATFIWGFGFMFEAASSSLSQQLLFNNIGYLGSMSVPVIWLIFAIQYTNTGKSFENWKKALLFIFPLFIVIMVWSNDTHHLMWSNEHQTTSGSFLIVAKTYGVLFWVAVAHNYTLITGVTIILIRQLFTGIRIYRKQAFILLFAVCLPLVWNIIYIFDLLSLPRKDLTPMMFAISGIAITLGLMRFKLFKTIPFAYPLILQQMNDGILVFDKSNRLLETNPAACRMTGLDNTMVGQELRDLCELSPLLECLSITDFGHLDMESATRVKGKSYQLDKQPLFNKQKQQVGWLATIRDISQRKQTDQELKERKEQYFTLVEHGNDGIIIVQHGLVVYANSKMKELSGYLMEDILEKPFVQFISPEQRELIEKHYQKRIEGQKSSGRYEACLINKNGQEVYVEISASLIEYDGQIADMAIIRDLTAHKQAELENQRLRDKAEMASRLAAIGEMAAGIAHEINNPLTGVIGFSELLAAREDLPEDIMADLQVINHGSQRVVEIVRRLLTFARQNKPVKTRLNVHELIDNTLEFRSYVFKTANIEVIRKYDQNLPWITADPGQLQQVFLNLVINAEQAMRKTHDGGKLTITTTREDNYFSICIADDGPGMTPEIKAKIFQPFFTTKGPKDGTGLGLSLAMAIILDHHGTIEVESEYGRGTAFTINLPMDSSETEDWTVQQEGLTPKAGDNHAASILVIDDEEHICQLVTRVLGQMRHKVESFSDPIKALSKLETTSFDLVLLDIRMPGMSGLEFYSQMISKRPELAGKVIFMTGDMTVSDLEAQMQQTDLMHISKPFHPAILEQFLNKALKQQAG